MRFENEPVSFHRSLESGLPYTDHVLSRYNDRVGGTQQIHTNLAELFPGTVRPIEGLPMEPPNLSCKDIDSLTDTLRAIRYTD